MKKRLLTVLSVILTFLMIGSTFSFAALVEPVDADKFTDVSDGDWFKEYVEFVASKGYMIGTTVDPEKDPLTFEPQTPLTRAMFATIVARYHRADVDDSKATIFPDVPVDQWYTGSIGWDYEKGIVNGYEEADGSFTFRPTKNITREELATMIMRYVKFYEIDRNKQIVGKPKIKDAFTDADKVQKYAKDAVDFCVKYGLVEGYPDGSFKPQREITRAEAAAIVARMRWAGIVPPDEIEYKVVAKVSKNGKSLGSLYTLKHTVDEEGLLVGKLAEEAFSDANMSSVENTLKDEFAKLSGIHHKVMTVGQDSYDVTVEPKDDQAVATVLKNGVAMTAEDWNAQLKAEEELYTQRADDFAKAAKLTGEAKDAWDAAAAAFKPTTLVTVEEDSLVLKGADTYAKAIQTAGIKLGIVAEKVGGNFEGYKALREYLTDPEGLAIKEPNKDRYNVEVDAIQEALSDKTNVLAPIVKKGVVKKGVPYTLGDANYNYKGMTLNLVNLYTSRAYVNEPDNVSGIVAILKTIQEDENTPYLGKYVVTVTVQEAE